MHSRRLSVLLLVAGVLSAGAAEAQSFRDLHGWYDPERKDYHTTAHRSWQGAPGQTRSPKYAYQGREARLLAPRSGGLPGATGRIARYWNGGGTDNASVFVGAAEPSPGDRRGDATMSAIEGLAFDRPLAGTVPLYRWIDFGAPDELLTSDPAYVPGAAKSARILSDGDYRFREIAAWAYPPQALDLARAPDPATFGFAAAPLRGRTNLLVVALSYADAPIPPSPGGVGPQAYYSSFFFGTPGANEARNIARYFSEMSGGAFTWSNAGVFAVTHPRGGAQALAGGGAPLDQATIDLVDDRVDFSRFDADGDGVVEANELVIARLVAPHAADGGNPCLGQNRGIRARTADGVRIDTTMAALGWRGELKVAAEELMHSRGGSYVDLYGPGASLNERASVFSGSRCRGASDAGAVHLDPWHKMLAGWTRPRIVPITDAGGVAAIAAAQLPSSNRTQGPVLFYDPTRETNEFLLVEYRAPELGQHDAEVLEQGVAVWYVHHDGIRGRATRATDIAWPHGGRTNAAYLLAPNTDPKGGLPEPGAAGFWKPSHGEFRLRWRDGDPVGLVFEVGRMDPGGPIAILRWRREGKPFAPRLDSVTLARTTDGQISVEVRGVMPVGEMVTLKAIQNGVETVLGRQRAASGRVELVTTARLAAGGAEIVVDAPAVPAGGPPEAARSNGVLVAVPDV